VALAVHDERANDRLEGDARVARRVRGSRVARASTVEARRGERRVGVPSSARTMCGGGSSPRGRGRRTGVYALCDAQAIDDERALVYWVYDTLPGAARAWGVCPLADGVGTSHPRTTRYEALLCLCLTCRAGRRAGVT
jgi:hypothetical protein